MFGLPRTPLVGKGQLDSCTNKTLQTTCTNEGWYESPINPEFWPQSLGVPQCCSPLIVTHWDCGIWDQKSPFYKPAFCQIWSKRSFYIYVYIFQIRNDQENAVLVAMSSLRLFFLLFILLFFCSFFFSIEIHYEGSKSVYIYS